MIKIKNPDNGVARVSSPMVYLLTMLMVLVATHPSSVVGPGQGSVAEIIYLSALSASTNPALTKQVPALFIVNKNDTFKKKMTPDALAKPSSKTWILHLQRGKRPEIKSLFKVMSMNQYFTHRLYHCFVNII